MARQGDIKPRASGRASIPTPPVKFASDDKPLQVSRSSRNARKSRGFLGWLISLASRVTIFYLIYAALWTCPSRPFAFDYSAKDPRPVCRNIAQAHQQLVPIVKPYVHLAQQKAEPYTRPVIDAATPWVKRANKVARPIYRTVDKRGRLIWKKRIDPARRRALKKARKRIDPYLQQAHQYHKQNVQPHIDTVHKAVKPYHDIYLRDVSPYVDQAYQYSLQSSSVSYAFYMDKVHPRVVHGIKQIYSFLVNHVDPAVRRFYSLYVRPQLERLVKYAYERKAHYLGSDAIKTAQKEMKQAAHEADKHAKESIRKEQDAIKARDDPPILDRAKQAKDAVFDNAADKETDPVKLAQLDSELEAEEEKVKDLLEVWEVGMTHLIEKEYKLAVDRIADLRNRRLSDLPEWFGYINEVFVEDTVAHILNRLERGMRKISGTSAELGRKLKSAEKLIDQQIAKFDEATLDTKAQISTFYEELLQHEKQAIETSAAEVRRYAGAAKEAYDEIMRNAKFAVTMDEWAGWDIGVRKRATLFAEELAAVQAGKKAVSAASGAVDLKNEAPDMQKEINSLRSWTDKLHNSARKELIAYADASRAQLGGEGVVAKVSDVIDRLAEQASMISTDAAAGMLGAVGAARSKLGLNEAANDGYVARAKAYVASGTGSGSSFDDYIAATASSASSLGAQATSGIASVVGGVVSSVSSTASVAGSSVSSIASKASHSAASAVGASPSPETFRDYVEDLSAGVGSIVGSAKDGTASASSSASSLASKVSRSAASAVGASPSPETFQDYIEVAQDKVGEAVGSASSVGAQVASSVSSAAGVVSSSASSAVSVASNSASSLASQASGSAVSAAKSASSIASQVSRSGAKAVGASPTPETVGDVIEEVKEKVASFAHIEL